MMPRLLRGRQCQLPCQPRTLIFWNQDVILAADPTSLGLPNGQDYRTSFHRYDHKVLWMSAGAWAQNSAMTLSAM